MRYQILWLDIQGFAESAENIEAQSFEKALIFAGRKLTRLGVSRNTAGFVICYADSEFIRRYSVAPGGPKQTRAEHFDKEEMREQFPHLFQD